MRTDTNVVNIGSSLRLVARARGSKVYEGSSGGGWISGLGDGEFSGTGIGGGGDGIGSGDPNGTKAGSDRCDGGRLRGSGNGIDTGNEGAALLRLGLGPDGGAGM
jgi:hypothetical protein